MVKNDGSSVESSGKPVLDLVKKIPVGGDQTKFGPGARAMSDAKRANANKVKGPKATKSKPKGSFFAEAWVQNPYRLVKPGQNGGGNGLFNRFSPRPTPDPYKPGNAGGPRSVTVVRQSQRNSNLSPKDSSRQEITAHDGVKGKVTDKSVNHLTSKSQYQKNCQDQFTKVRTCDSVEIVSRIKEDTRLVKLAESAGNNQKIQKEMNEKLRLGNEQCGKGSKTLFGNIK